MKSKTRTFCFEESEVAAAEALLRELSGAESPEGSEQKAALELSADLLAAWRENAGFNTTLPERVRPFEISEDQRNRIEVSGSAVTVMTLANNIKKVLPYDMKTVRYTNISNWLVYIGALDWVEENGERKRLATPVGEELGIRVAERKARDGSRYKVNLYDSHAQKFILDNLESIMEHGAVKERAAKAAENEEGEGNSREEL